MMRQVSAEQLWRTLERIAAMKGLSISGLARRAGLEASSFNRCKRHRRGKTGWISVRTLFGVLRAADMSLAEFERMLLEDEAA